MSSNLHFLKTLIISSRCVLLAAVSVGVFIAWRVADLPPVPSVDSQQGEALTWPEVRVVSAENLDTLVYDGPTRSPILSNSDASARFRFAGTFFGFGSASEGTAVIDDLTTNREHLVGEGDRVGDLKILQIFRDRLVVSYHGKESTLTRGMLDHASAVAPVSGGIDSGSERPAFVDGEKLDLGKRIGEHRWVFSRAKMMDYYDDLMKDPERLESLFDSMKPVWTDGNRIEGYVLGLEGEKPFFDAVGFREGDVVRSVNGLNMTARTRAEYLIGQFAENRLNIIMIDVERGGEKLQLRYKFTE